MALVSEEFSIIVPAEATNEVTNPSAEKATTGYTAHGAGVAIARTATQQRRGVYSIQVTPASGVESGVYFGTVNEVSGTTKTFSVDVKGVAGQAMRIQIRTTAGALLSETAFTANGYWQRVKVTRTGNASTTRRLYVVRTAIASTSPFYVDGFYYSTVDGTYLDGDMKGFVKGQTDYRWLGTPHASQSWRSGQTRSGGTLLRIKDYARIQFTLGLGMATITNVASPVAADYSSYQTSRVNDREIIFSLAFSGADVGTMQANRQALIDAVRPDRTARKQPVVIRYQGLDASGGDASEPLDIVAHYVDGLENQPAIPGVEKANMRFIAYLPFLPKSGESGAALGYTATVANFANIGYRDTDGIWKAMGTGINGTNIYALVVGPDGNLYAGGLFTDAGGVANTANIARWDGSAWNALGTGLPAAAGGVAALAFGPDGSLYAGGNFLNAGGDANADYIARWDGANWSALGTGTGGQVMALAVGPDGSVYAGGLFTNLADANGDYISKWNGAAWVSLGSGFNGGVYALAVAADGTLYAGGTFTLSGATSVNRVAKWNGAAWSALSSGMDDTVYALLVGKDGYLYAGGYFNTAGGASVNNIARWNGGFWDTMGGGLSSDSVLALEMDNSGRLYAGGYFTSASGVTLPDRAAVWTGSYWMPLDVDVQDNVATFDALAVDLAGRVYIGGHWVGTNALSASVAVSSTGGARAYPVINFTGPGEMWQVKSYTTGKAVYFKNLTLLAGETARLDLRPGRFSFTSSFRGSLVNHILTGSDLDFYLLNGSNSVSSFMTGTTAASAIEMYWQDLYQSIDGAKR